MDFTLSKKHEMARSLFKEFAENEVAPVAQETDELEQFPAETVKKMAKAGFMGIPVPKEYGGQGCDPLTYAMCVEELAKVCELLSKYNISIKFIRFNPINELTHEKELDFCFVLFTCWKFIGTRLHSSLYS